jgi:hypothetical protein
MHTRRKHGSSDFVAKITHSFYGVKVRVPYKILQPKLVQVAPGHALTPDKQGKN